MDAAAIYAALAPLQPGDVVPPDVYIADYADGRRPAWSVAGRVALGADGVRLTLVDPGNGDLFDQAAVIVLAFPAKCLRTPMQLHGALGEAVVGGVLCDLTQQGRHATKERRKDDDEEEVDV